MFGRGKAYGLVGCRVICGFHEHQLAQADAQRIAGQAVTIRQWPVHQLRENMIEFADMTNRHAGESAGKCIITGCQAGLCPFRGGAPAIDAVMHHVPCILSGGGCRTACADILFCCCLTGQTG